MQIQVGAMSIGLKGIVPYLSNVVVQANVSGTKLNVSWDFSQSLVVSIVYFV